MIVGDYWLGTKGRWALKVAELAKIQRTHIRIQILANSEYRRELRHTP